ncbi:SGNH/GDSL hydrolase family protein [Vibrio parahaemolyticus]
MSSFPDLLTAFEEAVEALKVKLSQDASSSTTYNGEPIQSLAKDIEDRWAAISAMIQGRVTYETKAAMDAAGAPPNDVLAEVWNDTDKNNNGLFGFSSGAWVKSPYDPRQDSLNAIAGIETKVDDVRGPSFPGAAEYFEQVDAYNKSAILEVHDAARNVLLRLFGTETRYDGILETVDVDNDESHFVISDDKGVILFDSSLLATYEGRFESVESDPDTSTFVVLDAKGREMVPRSTVDTQAYIDETKQARGGAPTLDARLSKTIDRNGLSLTYTVGEWYLRECRKRLRKLAMGESDRLNIVTIGDSWSHRAERWTLPIFNELNKQYGISSIGWLGFAFGWGDLPSPAGLNGNIDNNNATVQLYGTWSTKYARTPSPDICSINTSTPGDKLTITTKRESTTVDLYYIPNGYGLIRYRFDGGQWTNFELVGEDNKLQIGELIGNPKTNYTLDIEHVAGYVEVCGVNIKGDGDGITVHKVAATGSHSGQWSREAVKEDWRAGLASLEPHLITILHGTNDQNINPPPTYQSNLRELINGIRDVAPLADILIIAPCENGRDSANPMSAYQEACLSLAYEKKCAFLNLQHVFGEDYSEYGYESERAWFSSDLIHPEPMTGGRVIADAVLRLISNL